MTSISDTSSEDIVVRPWAKQEPFLAAPERYGTRYFTEKKYHAFISGIGAGKTWVGISRVILNVEHWNPGELGAIVLPTSQSFKNVVLPEMRRLGLFDAGGWEYFGPQSEEPGIHTPNGSRILIGSADNDRQIERLRGPSLAWFWMDEAAIIAKKAWDIMVGRLRRGNYRNAFVTTTPKGFNWVYDRFYSGSDAYQERLGRGRPDDVNLIYGVKSTENPHVPDDYADITDEYDGNHYAQEVQGLFVSFEGLVYPWFDRDTHIVKTLPENFAPDTFYGVDFGHRNPSAILVFKPTRDGLMVIPEMFYQTRCTHEDLLQILRSMYDRWGPGPAFCDSAEASAIDYFCREGIDALPAVKDVTAGIRTVSQYDATLRVHQSCEPLLTEMTQYIYDPDNDADKPKKVNDHAMDALRYGLHTWAESGYNTGVVSGGGEDNVRHL